MYRLVILFICLIVISCGGQTKEELYKEGERLRGSGNVRGAIVLYKNALERDVNYLAARRGLAEAYLDSGSFDRAEREFKKVLLQNPSAKEVHLKLAEVYIQQHQVDKTLLELDSFHSNAPETSASLDLYGRVHAVSGDLDSAEKLFNKALLLDGSSIEPRLNLVRVYLDRADIDRAREALKQVIDIDERNTSAHYMLASLETREGRQDRALEVYSRLLEVNPGQLQALYMSGLLQLELGKFEAAEVSINMLLKDFSKRPEGSRLKGLLLYRQNNYEDAVTIFTSSLKIEKHVLSYFFLGLSYYGLEKFESALNQFQSALDLNPDFERARILVAMTLFRQKRLDDAVIEVQKVLRSNPNNAFAHNILGSVYLALGNYDKGMEELEAAIELDPTLADAHLKRGLFHLSKGEGAKGEGDLLKAVEAAPEVLNSRLMLVSLYLRQKNFSAAIEALQQGMDGSQADALLKNYLAAAYFSQQKPLKAIEALQQAKQVNPDYLTPYFNLASYYASQTNNEQALNEYRAILDRDPKNIRAFLGQAAVYRLDGNAEQLKSVYQQLEATGTEEGFLAAADYEIRQGRQDSALTVVNRGLEINGSSVRLLELKGQLHQQFKQLAEAESTYIKLSGVSPERGNRQLALLYASSGQKNKLAELVQAALRNDADKAYPYSLAATILAGEGEFEGAVEGLQNGIAAVNDPLPLRMQLGATFEASGKVQEAEQLYRRIIEDTPRFAPAYTSLGVLAERQGDKGQALDLYQQALKYDRDSVPALNNLAYLLADSFGHQTEALNYAMRAFRQLPNDPRIMDTLGYVLVKNDRAKDGHELLIRASQLLDKNLAVKLHLAMAKVELGQAAEAKKLLAEVAEKGQEEESKQAKALLKTL